MKLPAFQFYPGDWMKDPALRSVSLAARGLWIDMLCLMFEGDRRGYLQHATGKPVTAEQLARMTGSSPDEVSRLLQELDDSGVFSSTDHGVIFSRRMTKDERIRKSRASGGKLGASQGIKGKEFGVLGGRPRKTPLETPVKTPLETPQKPRSSSSSSSSSSEEENMRDSSSETPQETPVPIRPPGDRFAEFWALYPKKQAKDDAEKAWRKLTPELRALAIEKVAVYAEAMADRPEFVKNAQGWLNGKRWEDDPATWRHVGPNGNGNRPSMPVQAINPTDNEARRRKALGLPLFEPKGAA